MIVEVTFVQHLPNEDKTHSKLFDGSKTIKDVADFISGNYDERNCECLSIKEYQGNDDSCSEAQ